MEQSIKKSWVNAIPILSAIAVIGLSSVDPKNAVLPFWAKMVIYAVLVVLNVVVLVIRYRANPQSMKPRVIVLAVALLLAAAIFVYQLTRY